MTQATLMGRTESALGRPSHSGVLLLADERNGDFSTTTMPSLALEKLR
jgi:hypothetical protein